MGKKIISDSESLCQNVHKNEFTSWEPLGASVVKFVSVKFEKS